MSQDTQPTECESIIINGPGGRGGRLARSGGSANKVWAQAGIVRTTMRAGRVLWLTEEFHGDPGCIDGGIEGAAVAGDAETSLSLDTREPQALTTRSVRSTPADLEPAR